jgi:hypothetical protein
MKRGLKMKGLEAYACMKEKKETWILVCSKFDSVAFSFGLGK